MGLIKEGIDKIKCGIGWHWYYAIPIEIHMDDHIKMGHPHYISYVHECRRCGFRNANGLNMLRGVVLCDEIARKK